MLTFKHFKQNDPHLEDALTLYIETFRNERIVSTFLKLEEAKQRRKYLDILLRNLVPKLPLSDQAIDTNAIHLIGAYNQDQSLVGIAMITLPGKQAEAPFSWQMIIKSVPLIRFKNIFKLMLTYPLASAYRHLYPTIEILAVGSAYQGRGYGKLFLAYLTNYFKQDYAGLYLTTGNENTVLFYEKMGYDVVKHHHRDDLDVYELVKAF